MLHPKFVWDFRRALMEEGQCLSQQGNGEESSSPKTADIECVNVELFTRTFLR